MANETTAVHVTHEAVGKIGGIGAVLEGFFTCRGYLDAVKRSILVGPLFSTEGPASNRLGENGEVLYSSVDGIVNSQHASTFRMIENFYNVSIVYGKRTFIDKETGIESSPEVLLIDVRGTYNGPVNEFKRRMYDEFGIRSDLYEHIWECEQYVRLAPVAIAALKEIGAAGDSTIIISHEFMGMPTVLAGILETSCDFKTVFYAHEVATIRRIVEKHPGHDTMFYNALRHSRDNGLYVDDVFGDQSGYFKHALIKASKHCDSICAVGDYVAQELEFLCSDFRAANIKVVYNGIPAYQISPAQKQCSKAKLQLYCQNLLGYKPDFIFTHVTRLVTSKGLWRDLNVLRHIEKEFRVQGKNGVMFLLSTEVAQRNSEDIGNMESAYNWPVAHREGWPDLSGGEAALYAKIQEFNARSSNIKIVFVNQFGWESKYCGQKMPDDMEFTDIRKGSDVEFGLSIYEPFGIAPLEPLTFGGICVISNVSGCAGLVRDVANGQDVKNVIIADYTNLDHQCPTNDNYHLHVDKVLRRGVEDRVSEEIAGQIWSYLPKSESEVESMILEGYQLAKNMSWDVVVEKYILESLQKALHKSDKTASLKA